MPCKGKSPTRHHQTGSIMRLPKQDLAQRSWKRREYNFSSGHLSAPRREMFQKSPTTSPPLRLDRAFHVFKLTDVEIARTLPSANPMLTVWPLAARRAERPPTPSQSTSGRSSSSI